MTENIAGELRSDAERWLREIRGSDLRSSIRAGNATRASRKLEYIMRALLEGFAEKDPTTASAIISEAGKGKPTDKMTMGEYIETFKMMEARGIGSRFSRSEWKRLNSLPAKRNAIIHKGSSDAEFVAGFLEDCIWFCDLPFESGAHS